MCPPVPVPVLPCCFLCAGRCRQLGRCFEVLDSMAAAGVTSDATTFTCLIEAAVLAGEPDMARRVFARAMAAGITSSVQVRADEVPHPHPSLFLTLH